MLFTNDLENDELKDDKIIAFNYILELESLVIIFEKGEIVKFNT